MWLKEQEISFLVIAITAAQSIISFSVFLCKYVHGVHADKEDSHFRKRI